tara:strand:- start:23392 stop:23880 length:489 start_codon:yes stop_codon:yes gene_type:complete
MRSTESNPPRVPPPGDLLTSPFGLAERLTSPRFRVDTIAFADLAFICLLTLFLSRSFLFSPGVPIDLPTFEDSDSVIGVQADAVATVWQGKIVTVLGSYPMERMDSAFRDLFNHSGRSNGTLLLLTNRSTPFESISRIYDSARSAGFGVVQMAGKDGEPSDE